MNNETGSARSTASCVEGLLARLIMSKDAE